jgi:hypothetical protein
MMLNRNRFHELCRRAAEEQDPLRLHETGRQMLELLQDEELALLSRDREETYKRLATPFSAE